MRQRHRAVSWLKVGRERPLRRPAARGTLFCWAPVLPVTLPELLLAVTRVRDQWFSSAALPLLEHVFKTHDVRNYTHGDAT